MLRKLIVSLLLSLVCFSSEGYACATTPAFTYSLSHTCGLPTVVSATNTTSGNLSNTFKYWWKVNYVMATDTIIGKAAQTLYLKRAGTNYVKLFVKDTGGCIDSFSANITVTTNAKSILDQNQNYTYEPWWMNCLQFVTDPDSFRINIESADTLKNLRIFWGDGSSDLSGNNLPPNTKKTHLYTTLGVFPIKIVTTTGSCTDTVYGMVYNQRQPTAGIIGPVSGSNRGCVPHTLRVINNSYNISNNTKFYLDWGNGDLDTKPYTAYKDTFYHTYRKGVCSGVIKITATNVCGSSFTTWNPIDISDKDKAKWSVTPTCNPTASHVFLNLSTDKYCLIPDVKEYFWDFGDGTTVGWTTSKASQSHIFKTEGDYTVTLIAKTACGNDTFSGVVPVYYNPVAAFAFDKNRGCKPLAVKLTDTSRGRGATRTWTVIDGNLTKTFTDSILNYTFLNPGNNSVKISVTNSCNTDNITKTFVVTDKPKARFDSIPSRCVPVTTTFTNTSISYFSSAKYTWNFGDGTSSTLKNPPAKIYNTPGTYTVKLYVSDSCGTDSMIRSFTVYHLPNSVISGDTAGCTFDALTFRNSSTGASDFTFQYGDFNFNTKTDTSSISHTYSSPGNYTVKLIATNIYGCKDTSSIPVNIRAGVDANFTIQTPYACAPATFKITNTSVFGKDYKWYANNQLISTGSAPADSTLYTDSSVVRIKLVGTSVSTCRPDSIEKVYFTAKHPVASFNHIDSGCGPLSINFSNQSTYTYASLWNFGNGSSSTLKNPTAVFAPALSNDTNYSVKLKVTNWLGCADSTSKNVLVFPKPKADFSRSDTAGCGPKPIVFTNNSSTNNTQPFSSLTHFWRFGDGSTDTAAFPTHTFQPNAKKDTFYRTTLRITSIKGCNDSVVKSVKIYPKPSIRFTPDKTDGCALLSVNFTNQSIPNDTGSINIMSFFWNSGNGIISTNRQFSATYNASLYSDTSYPVSLIGTTEHGCVDTLTKYITVHPNPVAQFNVITPTLCTPVKLNTNNTSVSRDGFPITHQWVFGNGYQSFQANDSTIYFNNTNNERYFTIVYQAISKYNCRDTATYTVNVHPKPIAKFGVDNVKLCAPAVFNVSDSSINAATYFWGENTNYKGNLPNQAIRLEGSILFDTIYYISHAVQSADGCLSDTVYKPVVLIGKPDAKFEYSKDSGCMREPVFFVNNSLGSARFDWSFGDNTSSTTVNPRHQYRSNNGNGKDSTFMVRLIATSSSNCKDTFSKPITLVTPAIDGMFLSQQIGCTDLNVQLINRSQSFPAIYWDFGDNTPMGFGDTVSHVFINNIGNITFQPKIRLYRQKYNCRDTVNNSVMVYPRPIADFRVNRFDPCNDGTHLFVSSSKYQSALTWLVDSTTITGFNSFNFKLPSAVLYDTFYPVRLIADNIYGCSDTLEQIIKVKPKLLVQFTTSPTTACENATVNLFNTSYNAKRYLWKFGDEFISNDMNPSHAYSKFGNYKIMLYGYDKDGCVDSSDGKTIMKVLERPVADFSYLPTQPKLPNAIVNFKAQPTILTANVDDLNYEWDFGDGTFPTTNKNQKDPTHNYTTAGMVEVKLKVANNGCENEVSKFIFIEYSKPIADFTTDTLEGCSPFRVKFNNNSAYATSYRWIFGDGTPDGFDAEPTHIYKLSGTWDVTLVATGPGGISSITKLKLITTYPKPFLDFTTTKRFLPLPNAIFNMQNNSNSVYNTWDVFDSTGAIIQSSKLRDPSFYVNALGRYDVRLIGTNSWGCVDTLIKPSYIGTIGQGQVFVPNAFSPNNNSKNEGFMPSLYNVMDRNYTFRVFNRWGEMVYETHDLTGMWDGRFKGNLCEQDVYIYTINGEYYNNDLFSFRGTVTLLR